MLPTKIVRGPFPPAFKCICPNQSNLKLWSIRSRPLSVVVRLREGKSPLATLLRASRLCARRKQVRGENALHQVLSESNYSCFLAHEQSLFASYNPCPI